MSNVINLKNKRMDNLTKLYKVLDEKLDKAKDEITSVSEDILIKYNNTSWDEKTGRFSSHEQNIPTYK